MIEVQSVTPCFEEKNILETQPTRPKSFKYLLHQLCQNQYGKFPSTTLDALPRLFAKLFCEPKYCVDLFFKVNVEE